LIPDTGIVLKVTAGEYNFSEADFISDSFNNSNASQGCVPLGP
jgi:hypothetical protein